MREAKRSFPLSLKALLIFGSLIVLLVGGVAFTFYAWWQIKGAAVVATIGEGTRFGTGKDRQACVTEAVLRVKRGGGLIGLTEEVKDELFLAECLKVATPVAAFCDGVPPKSDLAQSASWQQQMSRKYGLEGKLRQGLVSPIQDLCNTESGRG